MKGDEEKKRNNGKGLSNKTSTPSSQTPLRGKTQDQRRQGPEGIQIVRHQASHPLHPSLPAIPRTADDPSIPLPKVPSRVTDKHELSARPMAGSAPTGPSYTSRFKAKSTLESRHSSSSTPTHSRREYPESRSQPSYRASSGLRHPRSRSSSPSPLVSTQLVSRKHSDVVAELAKNGNEYVKLSTDPQLMSRVREDDVIFFLHGFKVDKVCFSLTRLDRL